MRGRHAVCLLDLLLRSSSVVDVGIFDGDVGAILPDDVFAQFRCV